MATNNTKAKATAAKPPAYLKEKGRKKWRELVAQLGEVKASEADALGLLAASWEMYLSATEELQQNGLVYRDTKNGRLWNNPATNAADLAWKQIVKLSKLFGLLPDRGQEEEGNPFAEE